MERNDVVKILKPHPWHGVTGVITEGPYEEDNHYGVIVGSRLDRPHYLSIPEKWLKLVESAKAKKEE